MMKSLRLVRTRRQPQEKEGGVIPTAAASAVVANKSTATAADPEGTEAATASEALPHRAPRSHGRGRRLKSASSSSSLMTTQSTGAATATESSSSLESSFSGHDEGNEASVNTSTTTTAAKSVAVAAASPREGRKSRLPLGGCLRVKTQQESLQRKYNRSRGENTLVDRATTTPSASEDDAVAGAKIIDPKATNHLDRSALADAGGTTNVVTGTGAAEAVHEATATAGVVNFSDVTIHSHQWILGDNPSVTSGPPITIEWSAFATSTLPLDDYELGRLHDPQQPPRHHSELQAPAGLRTAWMLRAGFTHEEIATAEKQVRIVQQRRSASLPRSSHVHSTNSPYNPCGKYNAQLKKGTSKFLWGLRPKRAGRKASDDDEDDTLYL